MSSSGDKCPCHSYIQHHRLPPTKEAKHKVFRTLQAGQITIVHMIDQHKHHRQQDQHQQGEQHGHRSEDQGICQDLNSQLDQLDKIEVVNKIDLQAQTFSKLIAAFCGRASYIYF